MPAEHIFVNIKEGNQDYFLCKAIFNKTGDSLAIGTYPGSWYLDVTLDTPLYQNDNICFFCTSVIGRPIACVEPETIRPGGYVADAGGTICTGNFQLYFGYDPE